MKKLGKIVGIGVGGYLVFNTLVWTFIGLGRFLNDWRTDEAFEDLNRNSDLTTKLEFAFDKEAEGIEIAINGWKNLFKG